MEKGPARKVTIYVNEDVLHRHTPLHDDDNCSICQYLAAHGVALTLDATLHFGSVAEPVQYASSPCLPGAEQFQLPIRGPPALGC